MTINTNNITELSYTTTKAFMHATALCGLQLMFGRITQHIVPDKTTYRYKWQMYQQMQSLFCKPFQWWDNGPMRILKTGINIKGV